MMEAKYKTIIKAEPGKQEFFIEREFDAPRELVFRALNEPELLVQWLGPRGMNMNIEMLDNRSGGSYRFIHEDSAGHQFHFKGVIHEVIAPERVIRTFEFEGLPDSGHVSLEVLLLSDLPDGRCKMLIQSVFRSVADRDGMIRSGMERGAVDSYERLDALLLRGF